MSNYYNSAKNLKIEMTKKMSVVSSCFRKPKEKIEQKKIGMWLYDSLLHKKYLLIKYYFYSYCNNHLTLFTIFLLKMLHAKLLLHTILQLLLLHISCQTRIQAAADVHGKSELYNRRRGAWQSELVSLWFKKQGKQDKFCPGTKFRQNFFFSDLFK